MAATPNGKAPSDAVAAQPPAGDAGRARSLKISNRKDMSIQRLAQIAKEEFKGTGNMEIHLDRKRSDKRVPRDRHAEERHARRSCKVLAPLPPVEAMELLLDKIGKTKTNGEFLAAMQRMA